MIFLDFFDAIVAILFGIVFLSVVFLFLGLLFARLRSVVVALIRWEFKGLWRAGPYLVSVLVGLFAGAVVYAKSAFGGVWTSLSLGGVVAVVCGYSLLALVFHRVRWFFRPVKFVLCSCILAELVNLIVGLFVGDELLEAGVVWVLSTVLSWVVLYERDTFRAYLSRLVLHRGVHSDLVSGKGSSIVYDQDIDEGSTGSICGASPMDVSDIGGVDPDPSLGEGNRSPSSSRIGRARDDFGVASIEIVGIPESYFASELAGVSQGDVSLAHERDVVSRFRAFVASLLMGRRVFAFKLVFSGGRGRLFIQCRERKKNKIERAVREVDAAFHSSFPNFETKLHFGNDVESVRGSLASGWVSNLPAPSVNPMRYIAELFINEKLSGCVTIIAKKSSSVLSSKLRKSRYKRLAGKARKEDQQYPLLELITKAITSSKSDYDAQKELEYRARELERMDAKVQAKCWITIECQGSTYDEAEVDLDLALRTFVAAFTYEGRHEALRWGKFPRRKAEAIHELTSRLVPRGSSTVLLPSDLALYFWLPEADTIAKVKRKGDFLAPTRQETVNGEIFLGNVLRHGNLTDQKVFLSLKETVRHIQVGGSSGSGKTWTTMCILLSLHRLGVPFLVLDPVKKEYRSLIGVVPGLRIFTVGDETVAPLRFNILRVPMGVKPQKHSDLVHAALVASIVMYPPAPYVLQMALNETYAKNGWDLLHGGRGRDFSLPDLNPAVEEIVRRRGYEGEVKANIAAALSTRFESLSQAGKGAALCSSLSMSPREFIEHPTVVEFSEMGSEEDRAMVILMMLLSLYEYLATLGPTSKPRCAIVIEEAGSLFAKAEGRSGVEYTASEARGKAVEVISNVIAQIRSLGAIIIFVNQSAANLPLEVTENTSTKIIHQVADDVDAGKVARMLGLSGEQKRALTSLEVGRPVVKTPGVSHPFQVEVASLARYGVDPTKFVTDGELRDYMRETFYSGHPEYLNAETAKTMSPAKQTRWARPPIDTGDSTALMVVASAGFGERYAQAIRACKVNNVKPLTNFLWSWAALSAEKGGRAVRFALNIFTEASVRYNAEVKAGAFWKLYSALEIELAEKASSSRVGSGSPSH